METLRETVQEFEEVAWTITRAGLDERAWTTLRSWVVALIDRGQRVLARHDGADGETWSAMRWERTDSPALLARAFGTLHRRLAATLERPVPAGDTGVAA